MLTSNTLVVSSSQSVLINTTVGGIPQQQTSCASPFLQLLLQDESHRQVVAKTTHHACNELDTLCLQTPSLLPFPDLTQPELAYPMYPQPEIDAKLIARIDDVYLRNLDMPELIEKARLAVIGHAAKLLKQDPGRTIDYIVLDMPCTFVMLRSLR